MIVDTHCHLDFDRFDDGRDAVIFRAREAGVETLIVPAVDLDNCQAVVDLTEQYDGVFGAVGVHPNSTKTWDTARDIPTLRHLAETNGKIVSIGEIGLDYYWDKSPKQTQFEAFEAQMGLAADLHLPIIIHNREASEDCIDLMAKSPLAGRENAGVMHSFGADYEIAKRALNLGFYLGFTGPITYKNASMTREIASKVPLDRILVETDAPFLAPQKYRGKRNEPSYVVEVVDRIAAVRQISFEAVAEATTENARRLFGLETDD